LTWFPKNSSLRKLGNLGLGDHALHVTSELSLEKSSAFPGFTDGSIAKTADGKDNLEISGSSFFTTLALSVTL
jgi:hypothetical protein